MNILHPYEPVYNEESEIMILGTFPSVKSRENNFYYGHPQNRFWKLISKIADNPLPVTINEKKELLIKNKIALWDVVKSCDIEGSADSDIKNPLPNDINSVVKQCNIRAIYFNGKKAYELYMKYVNEKPIIKTVILPSSSPANAQFSFERLYNIWKNIKIN